MFFFVILKPKVSPKKEIPHVPLVPLGSPRPSPVGWSKTEYFSNFLTKSAPPPTMGRKIALAYPKNLFDLKTGKPMLNKFV